MQLVAKRSNVPKAMFVFDIRYATSRKVIFATYH